MSQAKAKKATIWDEYYKKDTVKLVHGIVFGAATGALMSDVLKKSLEGFSHFNIIDAIAAYFSLFIFICGSIELGYFCQSLDGLNKDSKNWKILVIITSSAILYFGFIMRRMISSPPEQILEMAVVFSAWLFTSLLMGFLFGTEEDRVRQQARDLLSRYIEKYGPLDD